MKFKIEQKGFQDWPRFRLQKAIAEAVNRLQGLSLRPEEVHLEHPENEDFGDYASNIAMQLFSRIKGEILRLPDSSHRIRRAQNDTIALKKFSDRVKLKTPMELAEAIKDKLLTNYSITSASAEASADRQLLNYCSVAAPGFINISIKTNWFIKELARVLKEGEDYGKSEVGKNKKIMVEYAHPNTHKQFHIGHLRNISLGESLVSVLETVGFKVIRANYQGDVGLHIAKCLRGIKRIKNYESRIKNLKTLDEKIEFLGKCYAEGNKAYEEDEKAKEEIKDINYLIYASAQKFHQEKRVAPGSTDYMWFVKGEEEKLNEIYKLWKETRQWSLDYFERIYKRVGTRFDRLYFESEMLQGTEIAKKAFKKGILKKSKGAVVFDGQPYNLDTRVFITKLGLPTYEAKELKLAQLEFSEFGQLGKNIHVVGPEQSSFFKVTFKVEELLDAERYRNKQFHLVYGWVRLKKGKMSSRLGTVITGEYLLNEAKKRIKKAFPKTSDEVAEKIAVGAVKYSFLKVSPGQELAFDFDESISLQGNSGPYLQYTYARCHSVLKKASQGNPVQIASQFYGAGTSEVARSDSSDGGGIGEPNPEELAILRWFYRFPEAVLEAAENYSPNLICNFLYDLAQRYNAFYNKHRILGSKNYESRIMENFRLLLTAATAQVLKNGLHLLGIEVIEKM